MKRKLIAGLLALSLVFSLFGCQKEPSSQQADTQPTETTLPAPDPAEVYAEACAPLEAMADVTLDVTLVKTTTVEGHSFVDESEQILTYAGRDTDAPVIYMEKEVSYNVISAEDDEDDEDTTRTYSEIYADGTLYMELEEEAAFSGSLGAEESAERYVPVVLLDATLYGEMELETQGDQTIISFEAPTAPESWAMPAGAQLLEASGSAVIGAEGKLDQMHYIITYQYGAAEVCLEIESAPRAEAAIVVVPEDTERYTPVQSVNALQMMIYSVNMMNNAQVVSLTKNQSILSEAGGVAYDLLTTVELYDTESTLMTKLKSATHVMDPVNGAVSTIVEETYRDGTYVLTVDNGVPTSQSGVPEEDVRKAYEIVLAENVAPPSCWQDVTIEDLGSAYLLEYTYTEDFGNSIQNTICQLFWQDPTILNREASSYTNNVITGYLAIDKYTGLMTASGNCYEGVHTIDGRDYLLSMQTDQMVKLPSFGAYKAITGELKAEEEPAEMATPLFYHVTGEEGQEMWLLGTIHVGDVRTGFLPREIYEAFEDSDALALEMNEEAFESQLQEDPSLAGKLSKAMYYGDGSTVAEHLGEELYAEALKYMKVSGNYSANMLHMKPYLWQSSIENFYLQQGHQLFAELGVEARLTALAKEQEKPIREVESGLAQVQLLTGWSDALQQALLEDTLSCTAEEFWTQAYELYELWCAGDEEALRKELSSEVDLSELTEEELAEYNAMLPLLEEYDKGMSHDRNAHMLKVAIDHLESGEVIFYAVGLAHLLDNTSGLVDALREAGYTVELVTYYQ